MIAEKELIRIEELAKKATQGVWQFDRAGLGNVYDISIYDYNIVFAGYDHDDCKEFGIGKKEDAEYITAVQPAFVLKLIEALRNK